MANQKGVITVNISGEKDVEVEVSISGISGGKCKDITRNIERALGTTTKDTETEEMKGRKISNVNQNRA